MDERVNRVAALANVNAYDSEATRKYIDGAPHIKHRALRELYGALVVRVYDSAVKYSEHPRVLDLGAGEGSVTLPFLELGAHVTAVDISENQLKVLSKKCEQFKTRLEVRCEDISETFRTSDTLYDIVVLNSFLHHIPDYLGLIESATKVLAPRGQLFSFQDPLRYDTAGRFTMTFTTMAYFSWRMLKGDVLGGAARRIRRMRGVYLDDCKEDNAEYHVTRNGVDQDAIIKLLNNKGLDCDIIRYFSTQSRLFQPVGTALGIKNTFAIVAQKAARR